MIKKPFIESLPAPGMVSVSCVIHSLGEANKNLLQHLLSANKALIENVKHNINY